MVVICARCAAQGRACGECVVEVGRPGRPESAPVDFTDAEQSALRALARAGLIPRPRFVAPLGVSERRAA
jgi:hypothetical protein